LKVNPQEYSVPKSQTNPKTNSGIFKKWFVFLMLLIIAALQFTFQSLNFSDFFIE
jgi:hypothetical protein